MAFKQKKMSKLGLLAPASDTTPSTSWWVYQGDEAIAAQTAAGFYNPWRKHLQVGDVLVTIGTDAAKLVVITAVPATGNVTFSARALS